ncbi:alpha/beta hydrolase [Halalkalibacterium halodurans]|uniref:alpha/beta fold hydrolase n=1 Tax=Halalkalibacterium halodurans TaxID=86665 RepID=UPI001067CC16|nr:alpha/beta hydrolase [Halalkalibacterium halodurans]MED3647410.1 alpha/beta hydrolase [Halalkalibacterium halodurans]MED4164562.1 alpha/beta hydrolase [Halalkalibacterium halodurans]TES50087.1 alpha/beta hydrolase [Halalkalibacterium halodurans]
MKFTTNDGLQLVYDRHGKGAPCLYLHGGPGYWSKSFQQCTQRLLEEKLEMIYLDQRGCGRSDHCPNKNYSLQRLIDDVEQLRHRLGIDEWYVMGHSFGGILAVHYAHRFPDRTKGLILVNASLHMLDSLRHQLTKGATILGRPEKEHTTNDLDLIMKDYLAMVQTLLKNDTYFTFQFVDITQKKRMDEVDRDGLNSDVAFQRYVFSSLDYFQDFTPLTAKIMKPTLVIAGAYDHAIGPKHHQRFKFEHSDVRVLKSAHHPYLEHPSEFQQAVLDFID